MLKNLKHPPILIGGKALEYYKIRKGNDFDFVIHREDMKTLLKTYEKYDFSPDQEGIKIHYRGNEYDFFSHIGPYNYNFLKSSAVKLNSKPYIVCSIYNLILLKSYVAFIEPEPLFDAPSPPSRKKAFKDLEKLHEYLFNHKVRSITLSEH